MKREKRRWDRVGEDRKEEESVPLGRGTLNRD